MHLDKNGCMGFPHQKFWMNIGPWMSQQMYYVQGSVLLLFMGILVLTLYKVDFNKLIRTVESGVRMQDNVIDATPYFLAENTKQAKGERRVGLGVMG